MIRFARNPDGSIKRKQPCQEPGCTWPNWHLCPVRLGADDSNFQDALRRLASRKTTRGSVLSDEHREAIAEAQRRRWARIRAERERQVA